MVGVKVSHFQRQPQETLALYCRVNCGVCVKYLYFHYTRERRYTTQVFFLVVNTTNTPLCMIRFLPSQNSTIHFPSWMKGRKKGGGREEETGRGE